MATVKLRGLQTYQRLSDRRMSDNAIIAHWRRISVYCLPAGRQGRRACPPDFDS